MDLEKYKDGYERDFFEKAFDSEIKILESLGTHNNIVKMLENSSIVNSDEN